MMKICKLFAYVAVILPVILFIMLAVMNYKLRLVTTPTLIDTLKLKQDAALLKAHEVTDKHFNDFSMQNITLKYGKCTGTMFPLRLVKTDTWHQVNKANSMYVFSAYMIRSKENIFIIGARLRNFKVAGFCQMWRWDKGERSIKMEVSEAYSTMPSEGPPGTKYSGTIIECRLNASFTPTHVSLSTTTCATPLNLMTLNDVITPVAYNHTFTVCLAPIFNKFDEVRKLVEWFELNRILGADQFIIYNYSIALNVNHVLRYYEQQGLVQIIQWKPLMRTQKPAEIHYYGQTAAMNDCLFRSKTSSEYLVNIDIDEYIIPHEENITNWLEMLQKLKQPKAMTYMFLSSFFLEGRNYTGTGVAERELIEKFELITLQKLSHEHRVFGPNVRSKYIVRTVGADRILIHEVPIVPKVVAPVETGLVHHYRLWGKDYKHKSVIVDNTVKQKFGKDLIKNVRNIWKDLIVRNVSLHT